MIELLYLFTATDAEGREGVVLLPWGEPAIRRSREQAFELWGHVQKIADRDQCEVRLAVFRPSRVTHVIFPRPIRPKGPNDAQQPNGRGAR